MSWERCALSDPAIALIEFDSISAGIVAGDAMVKSSPISAIYAGTVHPGKYLVLVSGDTASVEMALDMGESMGSGHVVDRVFLPDIHEDVVEAIVGGAKSADMDGEALGIVESESVASIINAADAGVKAAHVTVSAVRLADGLGGKGYLLLSGGAGTRDELPLERVVGDAGNGRGLRPPGQDLRVGPG